MVDSLRLHLCLGENAETFAQHIALVSGELIVRESGEGGERAASHVADHKS